MTLFMRKPGVGSRRGAALLAAAAGVALWGAAMAARAGDQPPAQPAAEAHSGAPAAGARAKPDPQDRVICREEERTGSILGGPRVCHTEREWEEMGKGSKDWLSSVRRQQNMERPK